MAGETLHPVVQLRFGSTKSGTRSGIYFERTSNAPLEAFIVTIPPEHLVEFTNVSRKGADQVSITFFDATFGSLEDQLFRADRDHGGRVLYRWGYPGLGLEEGYWNVMIIQDYVPTLSTSGLRITINGLAVGSEFANIAEPTVYKGKISTVVRQIAEEMGFTDETKVFIEETEDNARDEEPRAEWPSGNLTRIDLINQKLLPEAKSKQNPNGTYYFQLSSQGTFHFHTEHFKKLKEAVHGTPKPNVDHKYRRFNVLFGTPVNPDGTEHGVISFTPRYGSKSMGFMAAGCIAGAYDPRTKQFQQRVVDRRTQGMSSDHDPKGGGRTSAPPIAKKNDSNIDQRRKSETYSYHPVRQVALGGHCSGKQIHQHHGPDASLNTIASAWKRMHSLVQGGTLELVGIPRHVDFNALEMWCEIAVYMPSGVDSLPGSPTFKSVDSALHWSSGRYRIEKITHFIGTDYRITAELGRIAMLEGPDPAKTGLPQPTTETTTGTSR